MVYNVINNLYRNGAKVIYESLNEIHASGHACQEEVKLIHSLICPKFFIPVHGERRHLQKHAELAMKMGMLPTNIILADIGSKVEVTKTSIRLGENVPSGCLLVDGLGVGDVGSSVLRDRKHLSEDGLFVAVIGVNSLNGEVFGIDITSRGFMYTKEESEKIVEEAKEVLKIALSKIDLKAVGDWTSVKNTVRKELKNLFIKRTKRDPLIIPVILEN
jgi:ribonuclease J